MSSAVNSVFVYNVNLFHVISDISSLCNCRLKNMVARLSLLGVMSRKRLMWMRWWKPWVINCTPSYIP